jgi:hypothetical protein
VAATLKAKAAPVPNPISVNMFGLRFTTDAASRSKNGRPDHSTTGAASSSSTQAHRDEAPLMATATRGTVSAAPIKSLRVMSSSSGLRSSSATGLRGSSAMPHFGQLPGPRRTISGCIGHVYSASLAIVTSAGGRGAKKRSGSRVNRSRQPSWQK